MTNRERVFLGGIAMICVGMFLGFGGEINLRLFFAIAGCLLIVSALTIPGL